MNERITISGVVTGGRLPMSARSTIRGALLRLEGKQVRVTIERQKKHRSLNQNAFYWGCVIPCIEKVLEDFGNEADADMAHEVAKHMFLPQSGRRVVRFKGAPMLSALTSTTLSTMEFEEYIEKIRAWCAENGVTVPYPHEAEY